jgi:mannose-6-phosphate isomerase class I
MYHVGDLFDGQTIVEVLDQDETDDYQPYLYELENGETCWIPENDPDVTVVHHGRAGS